jgi:hypothetical protein
MSNREMGRFERVDLEAIFGRKAKSMGSEAASSSSPLGVVPSPAVSVPLSPENERLLARLRDEIARVKCVEFGGNLPTPLAHVLDDAVVIAENYVVNHEVEAARGWDTLELLRGMVPHIRRCVGNWKAMNDKKGRP